MDIEAFQIIGIAVRTTNENNQSGIDIPQLWQTFIAENIADQIPNKMDSTIYCLYTDYEKDHTKPYTAILGCRVESLTHVPKNMLGKRVAGGTYASYVAKGNLADGVVFNEWIKIWNSDLPRAFTSDFEIYGEKAMSPENAEVEICIATLILDPNED